MTGAGERRGFGAVTEWLLGPADPIRLDAFRVALAASLLLYLHGWWQEPFEWLTAEGFHLSTVSRVPTPPLLAPWALPIFGVLMFGSVGALLLGWGLPLTTWAVLGFVVYLTFADTAAAFTMNKIFIAALAVLAVAPAGAYFRMGRRPALSAQSVWPIRVLQATILIQYCTAGWCKVLHGTWLTDPLTLFSQAQGYYRTDVASWMLRNLPLDAWSLMQHAALAFELLAPLLFTVRRLRPLAFVWGAAFQLGTAVMMKDLIYFSAQMLSFYLLFVDDAWFHSVRLRVKRTLPPRIGRLTPGRSNKASRDASASECRRISGSGH